jgi:hypothetical protein
MLYKVTPMMEPEPKKKTRDPGAPRKRRATAIYDRDGNEVLVSLMCLKCRKVKPLAQFGLRKMADGAIRNQPWCRPCRSGAGTHKPKAVEGEAVVLHETEGHDEVLHDAETSSEVVLVEGAAAEISMMEVVPLMAADASSEIEVTEESIETSLGTSSELPEEPSA